MEYDEFAEKLLFDDGVLCLSYDTKKLVDTNSSDITVIVEIGDDEAKHVNYDDSLFSDKVVDFCKQHEQFGHDLGVRGSSNVSEVVLDIVSFANVPQKQKMGSFSRDISFIPTGSGKSLDGSFDFDIK